MRRPVWQMLAGVMVVFSSLLACSLPATPAAPSATPPPAVSPSATPSAEPLTQAPPSETTLPTEVSTPLPAPITPAIDASVYLDDRSTAEGVILSMFNAINRREYVRAYGYWKDTAENLPPYDQFQQGYADTASVQVSYGLVASDAGAGQLYFTVPVVLKSESNSGNLQTFSGCYTLHISQPAVQGVPPFAPLGIRSGDLQSQENGANTGDLVAHACDSAPTSRTPPLDPQPTTAASGLEASIYVDDRSGPIELLRSLFNAINRKEYLRAYSYWESGGADLPSFSAFEQGYADTERVDAAFGQPGQGFAAGNIYYTLGTALTATTSSGQTQYFAACYLLHLGQPANQGVPPFAGLAIQRAHAQAATSLQDALNQLPQACSSLP
jgi:hypothetical protein